MNSIAYTTAREQMDDTMSRVCNDHAPVIITREDGHSVVMMSLEDYESLEETAYLLRQPANAQRLRQAIRDVQAGRVLFSEGAW